MSKKIIFKSFRISHLNFNKLKRYFPGYETRLFIESIIEVSENNTYIKNKINETLKSKIENKKIKKAA